MMETIRSAPRPFAPPSVLPDISPSRGEITPAACLGSHPVALAISENKDGGLISPLEGEISGRTEGGDFDRRTFEALRAIYETESRA